MAKRAKQIEFGKFLIIACTAGDLMAVTGAAQCVCDWCGSPVSQVIRWLLYRCPKSVALQGVF